MRSGYREKLIPVPPHEQRVEASSDPDVPFDVILISRTIRLGEPGGSPPEVIEYKYRIIPKGTSWFPVEVVPAQPETSE